jgi:hypothetical protein
MMRAMRENAKWVFYILAVAFVGWMVFDVGMGVTGQGSYGTSDVVLRVDGSPIRAQEYQAAVNNAYEAYRAQSGTGPLTREDEEELQGQVAEDLIRARLLEREYRRLGIVVTDAEIIDAARTAPLPEFLRHPDLQTDGQFDPEKYQRLLSTGADPQLLAYIESRYREQIPQIKLAQYLTADVYVSDAKLWRIYRDGADSVTAAVLAIRPDAVADDAVPVSDDEVSRYYAGHREEFERPAVAHVSFVAVPRHPDASDTAAARERVARLRDEVLRGGAEVFADVARRESADSGSAPDGGDLGWFSRSDPPFVPAFTAAVLALRPGQVSPPIETPFGLHLIRLDEARRDSLRASHILVPIELAGDHLDRVEWRADSLDRIAGSQTSGATLDSAAAILQLPLAAAPPLVEGDRLQLGRYLIPDVGVWAFEAVPGETSPVIEALPAYYVFRLDSLVPAGTRPLAEVRDAVVRAARLGKKRVTARQRAAEALAALRTAPSLTAGATARGLPVETHRMTRLAPPPLLRDEPLVTGAAFGLRVGERSGVIEGRHGYYIVETLGRRGADSAAWVAQRETQRRAIVDAARQARIQLYLEDLKARATIVDRRKELARAAADAQAGL